MKQVIVLNKKEGETPLEALSSFRSRHKEYKDVPMTYAGRLDPMASGLLLVLAGSEVHKKDKYLNLDKEYEFEVLFGFATDTYDILGKVVYSNILTNIRMSSLEKDIKKNLKFFKGKIAQKYPMYSSKTVNGKQLWAYARGGEEVEVPEREVEIKNLKLLSLESITSKRLLQYIEKRIKKVHGDFRQKEILGTWGRELSRKSGKFFIASFKIKCSSGTYVRNIANNLGEKLGIPALAYKIKRTKIGRYDKVY